MHVTLSLPEMCVELADTFNDKFDIPVQLLECLADRPGLLPHPRIFQYGTHRIERRHAGRR